MLNILFECKNHILNYNFHCLFLFQRHYFNYYVTMIDFHLLMIMCENLQFPHQFLIIIFGFKFNLILILFVNFEFSVLNFIIMNFLNINQYP